MQAGLRTRATLDFPRSVSHMLGRWRDWVIVKRASQWPMLICRFWRMPRRTIK
jgi:hypothetical protein